MATPERHFSPEERASFLGWRFGSTLDWASIILTEIGYPVEENRWFVDAVCGVYQRTKAHYKDAGVPIPHGALAKRAQRFKNKSQASDLVRSAIERDAEWSRLKRMMIFDIERPKPHERMGKDKRAATKYTDYLTPAAVWAQGCEQSIKKADPAAWKNSKYRGEKRAEILAEAVKMLPAFESVKDMPPEKEKAEPKEQTLSEYVEGQQARELAARRRIVDKVTDGELTDADEIDARLAALDVKPREGAVGERLCLSPCGAAGDALDPPRHSRALHGPGRDGRGGRRKARHGGRRDRPRGVASGRTFLAQEG
jgi:hypothetical protein